MAPDYLICNSDFFMMNYVMTDDISEALRKNSEDIESLSENSQGAVSKGYKIQTGSLAYRMMVELVVGMIMGVGIGYGLDYAFNTFPFFLIIFSLLGFAAGVRVMLQTAKQINSETTKEEKL